LDDVDPKTLADASRRFFGLRRICGRLYLGGIGIFAVLATCLGVFEQERYPVLVEVLCLTLGVAFALCWLGFFLGWRSLTHFDSPRCGKRFIMAWWSSWPTSACKHCGLTLRQTNTS
jgi:hypothetical protein